MEWVLTNLLGDSDSRKEASLRAAYCKCVEHPSPKAVFPQPCRAWSVEVEGKAQTLNGSDTGTPEDVSSNASPNSTLWDSSCSPKVPWLMPVSLQHVGSSGNQGGFWFCCGLISVLNPLHNVGGKMLYLMETIWEKYCVLKGVTGAFCLSKCLQVTRCLCNSKSHFSSPPFAGRKMSLCDPADGPVLVHGGAALGCDSSAAHRPLSLPGDPPI